MSSARGHESQQTGSFPARLAHGLAQMSAEMGLRWDHLAGITGTAASFCPRPCSYVSVAASAVLVLSFPVLLSLWGVLGWTADNRAPPHGLQARNQTLVLTEGLFPQTPPLKSLAPCPRKLMSSEDRRLWLLAASSHLGRKEIPWASAVYLLAPGELDWEMMWLAKSRGF